MSDAMHVPLLVKYSDASHAAAGAIVGVAVEQIMRAETPASRIERLVSAAIAALAVGTAKEYLLDRHAHDREIPPWGVGACAALSFRYSF